MFLQLSVCLSVYEVGGVTVTGPAERGTPVPSLVLPGGGGAPIPDTAPAYVW